MDGAAIRILTVFIMQHRRVYGLWLGIPCRGLRLAETFDRLAMQRVA
jgi:hypothetical protein